MKSKAQFTVILAATLATASLSQAANTPRRVGNFNHEATTNTGLISTSGGYSGSGVVVRHPKVVASCAHVPYNESRGIFDRLTFHLRHNSRSINRSSGHQIRDFYYWTSYQSSARSAGVNSPRTFNLDAIAGYSHANFSRGAYAGWWHDGDAALRSRSTTKLVTGYPTARTGNYYQHYTGTFRDGFSRSYGRYLWTNAIAVGGGNSGGPVWAYNSRMKKYLLAGILVAGDPNGGMGTGVVSLDGPVQGLLNDAASAASRLRVPTTRTRTFSYGRKAGIADANPAWQHFKVPVSRMGRTISSLKASLDIRHGARGDLRVYLQTPKGNFIALHDMAGGTRNNVVFSNRNLTSKVRGLNPNGTWTLWVRDVRRGNTGYLSGFSLKVTTK